MAQSATPAPRERAPTIAPVEARPEAPRHLPALDGVRGLAVLLVVVHHFTLIGHAAETSGHEALARLAESGRVGVDLFFALSGFLITRILLASAPTVRTFVAFYARRALRIFPLYYVALLVIGVLVPALVGPAAGTDAVRQNAPWFLLYGSNYLVASKGWEAAGALQHFWSLAVEEQFYLVWPALVFALGARRLPIALVGLLAAAPLVRYAALVAGVPDAALYVATHLRPDGLILGGLLAAIPVRPLVRPAVQRAALAAAATGLAWGVVSPVAAIYPPTHPLAHALHYSLVALWSASVLVLALGPSPRVGRLLSNRTLRAIGLRSYAIYIFHILLKDTLMGAGIAPWTLSAGGSLVLGQALFLLLGGALTWGVASASWHLIERPTLGLKRHFSYTRA